MNNSLDKNFEDIWKKDPIKVTNELLRKELPDLHKGSARFFYGMGFNHSLKALTERFQDEHDPSEKFYAADVVKILLRYHVEEILAKRRNSDKNVKT